MTDLPFTYPDTAPATGTGSTRKCRRHDWAEMLVTIGTLETKIIGCRRCPAIRDEAKARTNRNNRKRGTSDELRVAEIVGGRKVGPLGLPWDVEVEGYLRLQAKKVDRRPSLNEVVKWLDGIPAGPELRGVTLADTPGPGRKTRRLVVFDLTEFAGWHGREK